MGKLLPHSRLFRAGRTAKQWNVLSTELSMTASRPLKKSGTSFTGIDNRVSP